MVSLIEVRVAKLMYSCKGSSEVYWTEEHHMHETTTRTEYYTSSIPLFKKEEYIIGRRSRHDKHVDFLQIVEEFKSYRR